MTTTRKKTAKKTIKKTAVKTGVKSARKIAPRRAAKPAASKIVKPAATVAETAPAYTRAAPVMTPSIIAAFEEFSGQIETLQNQTSQLVDQLQNHAHEGQTEFANAARQDVEAMVQFGQDLTKAASLTEVIDIQRGFWTSQFENRMTRLRDIQQSSASLLTAPARIFAKA